MKIESPSCHRAHRFLADATVSAAIRGVLRWQRCGGHQFAHYRKQLRHPPKFFDRKAVVHSHHIQRASRRLRGPLVSGFSIATASVRATTGNRTVLPAHGRITSGDSQTSRIARPRGYAQPQPCIARYAADAGCSTCFSGDAGLAAVELLIRISAKNLASLGFNFQVRPRRPPLRATTHMNATPHPRREYRRTTYRTSCNELWPGGSTARR